MKVQYNVSIPEKAKKTTAGRSAYKQIILNLMADESQGNAKIAYKNKKDYNSAYQSFYRYIKEGEFPIKIVRRDNDLYLVKEAADA